MEHLVVCLPAGVATARCVATSVEASPRFVRASRLLGLSCATSQQFGVVLLCCPACSLFARCLALEGLSRSEVVSVSWDPHPREPVEGVFPVARACTAVIARLCLVSVGVVGLALGRPVLLVVPASVFSRFRGPVLGCQTVMAPACVAPRPGGVSTVRGGVLSTASVLCPTPLVSAGVVCVARPRLVVVAVRCSLPLLSTQL
ncbi:hypothetical protein Taro_009787 [Colocasia esculenta]|uniref:Uncharacterized protein n=1 Tax=Colocasia esculenta TaxID=4460 RepID=A0A843U1F3_COLES|nr:hypothetical protein [Colocasia esculenta]